MAEADIAVAFPFVTVTTDTSALRPVVRRSPGVLAVVGPIGGAAQAGTVDSNTPTRIETSGEAATQFGSVAAINPLRDGLRLALQQEPPPSTIYGVRVDDDKWDDAFTSLEAADDVTVVTVTGIHEAQDGAAVPPAVQPQALTALKALKAHVDAASNDGNKRIGVAAVDPKFGRVDNYAKQLDDALAPVRSERIVMIAARGATGGDAGVAAAATIAGLAPSVSLVLKQIRGVDMPLASQYGPGEIIQLSQSKFVPVIDPALISGETLHLAEGRCYATGDVFVDRVRTLDDVEFRLKAGLIGLVGDARITRPGLILIKARMEGILGSVQREQAIDGFAIRLPVLDVLGIPEAARSEPDKLLLKTSRQNRAVDVEVDITLGPATHRVNVALTVL